MDLGVRGADEDEGPCRETRGRCAREVELERIAGVLSPDAWAALALVRAAGRQLRAGFGGAYAIDYGAVETTARWLRIDVTPNVLALFQVAENEVLEIYDERREERSEGTPSED